MRIKAMLSLCFAIVLAVVAAFAAGDLPVNGGFEKGQEGWRFYRIVLPAALEIGKDGAHGGDACAVLTGGKAFLHSAAFDVAGETSYTVKAWVKGEGKVDVGVLWWKEYSDNSIALASPHWQHMEEPVAATGEWKEITVKYTAPAEAARAYVRLVVSDGEVSVDDVSVSG